MGRFNFKSMEIHKICPKDFREVDLTQDEILELFERCDAFWKYDGEPRAEVPHAKLTGGKCSNGFFDTKRVLKHPNLNEILAYQLAKKLMFRLEMKKEDWIVGSPYGAITLSYAVSRFLGTIHGFPIKDPDNAKKMLWNQLIPKGARVLRIEDVITTSESIREVKRAIEEGNKEKVDIFPVVGTLIYRPNKFPASYPGITEVVVLIKKEVQNFKPNECPYCDVGSSRYSPKTHWEELVKRK